VTLKFRGKLMLSFLLVILVMGGGLYLYLTRALDTYWVKDTREGLLSEGRLARLTAAREIRDIHRDSPGAAAAIAREIRARVTIIATDGEVCGDSEVKSSELKELENHLQRPEVQQALQSGEGSALRHSATLRTQMLYVAFPFRSAEGDPGFLRLALPLSQLQHVKSRINAILAISLVVTTLLALVLSYVLSSVTSRSLRTIAAIATQIGKGETGRRIPMHSQDEVGEVAGIMNEMAARIESQLTTLSTEKNRLDTILRGMGEGVMVTDEKGVISLVNPAFRALFAIQDEVEGKPLFDISRHPSLFEDFKQVVSTHSERLDEIALPMAGEKTILTHWVPLMDQDGLRGVVAVFHDITDLKRLEKVRRDFVANVSHELRTPVAVIKGYAETLLDGMVTGDPDRAAHFIGIIHTYSERLASLIDDLLSLSQLESGDFSLELSLLPIAGTVRHACLLLERKALAKGITVSVRDIEEVPPVMMDQGRIEQVLINLLDNAINYTPEKGAVTITARDSGGTVTVEVSDTGIGIPPKDLPRVFERFYRVDSARSREQGGTGLGLSIVKNIVQLHGGTVSVDSTPGKGSTFSFTLKKG